MTTSNLTERAFETAIEYDLIAGGCYLAKPAAALRTLGSTLRPRSC